MENSQAREDLSKHVNAGVLEGSELRKEGARALVQQNATASATEADEAALHMLLVAFEGKRALPTDEGTVTLAAPIGAKGTQLVSFCAVQLYPDRGPATHKQEKGTKSGGGKGKGGADAKVGRGGDTLVPVCSQLRTSARTHETDLSCSGLPSPQQ